MNIETPKAKNIFQMISLNKAISVSGGILREGRFLVGRSESCDIIIKSGVVSSVHAILEVSSIGIKVYDMNSKNGTFVEGEKVIAREVKLNSKISFGNIDFEVTEYKVSPDLPPVLGSLEPISGEASVLKTTPKELPKSLPKVNSEDNVEQVEVPYIVYPLSADPESDYSEYIFEDKDDLYPIFKYELNKNAVEVIILFKDKVYSVDYLPSKNAVFKIAGLKKKGQNTDVEFPYLGKEERLPFIEIQAGNCVVHQLHKYEMIYLSDKDVKTSTDGRVNIQDNDIVKLSSGELEIYVRKVPAPPKVKTAPFFRRDQQLKKYLMMVVLLVFIPILSLYLYPVDEELLKEKDPERIATILYKQKLKINTNKTVAKNERKKKKVKQKSKVKTSVKKQVKQKTKQANATKSNQKTKKVTKTPGNKSATKTQKVKRVKRASKKTKRVAKSKASSKRSNTRRKQRRFSRTNTKSVGKVDVYKSMNFKSNISSLMAKGGSLRGASTASSSNSSNLNSASVGGGVESLKNATVDGQAGSLVGSASGKLGTTRGSEGLTSKTGVYTAGIPSETVVLGSMDPDVIRRILREHIPQFRSCYQRELDTKASQRISGTIRLVFSIGASGSVTRAGVDGRTALPRRVKGCVINVLRGIQFPSPMGGGTVDVKQPFNFYPKKV